ncbi:hypothetical protein P355_0619 [Burkholderia cenocepacia KC-01]|nr:hypothetical protein P355_0619 [Burkholderia cenocepacia KC-01]
MMPVPQHFPRRNNATIFLISRSAMNCHVISDITPMDLAIISRQVI